jgi:hypothetical protein
MAERKRHWYVDDTGQYRELALCGLVGARDYRVAGSPDEVTCKPCLKKMPCFNTGITEDEVLTACGHGWLCDEHKEPPAS